MFVNSWVTLQLVHNVANVLAILNFTVGLIGITIAFCGPMDSQLTTSARMHYLQIPSKRSLEIWHNFLLPLIMLYAIVLAYKNGWYVFGMFLSFTGLLWILRAAMLKQFPERGYLHRPFELTFELGKLKLIKL